MVRNEPPWPQRSGSGVGEEAGQYGEPVAVLDLADVESSHCVTYAFYLLQLAVWTLPCVWEEMNTFLIVPLTVVRPVTRGVGMLVVKTYRNNPGETQCESPEKKSLTNCLKSFWRHLKSGHLVTSYLICKMG